MKNDIVPYMEKEGVFRSRGFKLCYYNDDEEGRKSFWRSWLELKDTDKEEHIEDIPYRHITELTGVRKGGNEMNAEEKEDISEGGASEVEEANKCPKCGGRMIFSDYCGVDVCDGCGYHRRLAQYYCGWNLNSYRQSGEVPFDDVEDWGEWT